MRRNLGRMAAVDESWAVAVNAVTIATVGSGRDFVRAIAVQNYFER
jgi:hypothetical protein